MKEIVVIITFLLIGYFLHGQDIKNTSRELGLDVSTQMIHLAGGTRDLEIDIIYRVVDPKKDIRYKLSFSGQNFVGKELVDIKEIEFNSATDFKYFEAIYESKMSFIGSVGFAKHLKINKIPIYAGIDLNIGIVPGVVESWIREMDQGLERTGQLFTNQKNNLLILGVTPVVGIKKQLTDEFGIGIEFGINVNSVQGKLAFKNELEEVVSVPVFHMHTGAFRLINDISVFLKI